MDLRTHYPFSLLRHGLMQSYSSLKRNISTDVAIIGAGITGALTGLQLTEQGIPCVLVDKRHAGMGSTAASTSLIQYEIDTPLHRLIEMVGLSNAVRSYELSRQAVFDLEKICRKVNDKKNYDKKCSLQIASYKKDAAGLEREFMTRQEYGFATELLSQREIKRDFGFHAYAGLMSKDAAQLDAYRLTHHILKKIAGDGASVYDHTEITDISHEKRSIRLITREGHTITARHLVIACGYESGRYLKKQLEDLRCTYAIVSECMPSKDYWKDNCLIWEASDPYLYLRTTSDHRIMIGGKDTAYMKLQEQLKILPQKAKALVKSFQKLFPAIPIKIDFEWAGAFATTKDGLPYIGCLPELKHTYFALGYGGNGITFSLLAAQMIASLIAGKKHPDMDIFSFNRK
jgi:glycine/D-amino acid oxidase-like deaminating enzyme